MAINIARRKFIAAFGGAAFARPLGAHAQQPDRMRRIGVLMTPAENDPDARSGVAIFRQGLHELGWSEGRNLQIDYRWGGGDVGRIKVFAKELIDLSPDVIVGHSTPSVVALRQETRSIPIVFLTVTDPVGQGLKKPTMSRPAASRSPMAALDGHAENIDEFRSEVENEVRYANNGLTPALGQHVFFPRVQHREPLDVLKIMVDAGLGRKDRPGDATGHDQSY